MDYYGRQRALCGGSLGPPGKSGVGIKSGVEIRGSKFVKTGLSSYSWTSSAADGSTLVTKVP